MAKARKTKKPATRRTAKKAARKRPVAKAKPKARKVARPKARRAKAAKEGPIESALHTVSDVIQETGALRRKLAGPQTFED